METCDSINSGERKKLYFEMDSEVIMRRCAEIEPEILAAFLREYPEVPRYLAPYLYRERLSKQGRKED